MKRSLLVGIAEDGLDEVLSAFETRSYQSGDVVIEMGDDGDEMFLLTAGKVRVWTQSANVTAQRTLRIMGPGEHFGEGALLSGGPRMAGVTALTFIETLVLSGDRYRTLVKKHPQLLENLGRSLTRRLSYMNSIPDQEFYANQVHSLAIVIDHPVGLATAVALIDGLRQHQCQVQPILLSDQQQPVAAELFPDASMATFENLAMTVAKNSQGDSIGVVIATDESSAKAAIKQCNRVVGVVDATGALSGPIGDLLAGIAASKRPIAALMMDSSQQDRPPAARLPIQSVLCRYQADPDAPGYYQLDDHGIIRLQRSVLGLRIGLALGGGGARGIAHIGVLEVFRREGIVFDSISGTSAGSIVAASIGAGFLPQEVGEFFRREMHPPRWMASHPTLRAIFLFYSFRGRRFEIKLRRYLHDLTFSQLDLPISTTTLDLVSGEQIIRRSGDVVAAVLQSINHPVFGRPIQHEEQLLVDGGVLMNVPASVLRDEGCDRVISVDVGSTLSTTYARDETGQLKAPGSISGLLRTMDISSRHSSDLYSDESDLIIHPETGEFRLEDFHAVDELVEAGRRIGERTIDEVKQLVHHVAS